MKQRYLKNFTGQKLLVIFMVICSSLINGKAISQTTYYVNDNNSTGDIFCSAVGSNSNSGTASAPFATLTYGISQASAGDIIYVDAGTYTEAITVNKRLDIRGQGNNTIIQNSGSVVFTYTAAGSGSSSGTRAYLKNLKISGSAKGLSASDVVNYLTLDGVNFDGNSSYAIHLNNTTGTMLDWVITNSTFNANADGFRMGMAANIDGLSITGTTFSNQVSSGIYIPQQSPNSGGCSNVTITGNTFTNNANASSNNAAIYIEKLSNATIGNNTITDNGPTTNPRGILLNLKYGNYSNVTISGNILNETRVCSGTSGMGILAAGLNTASYAPNPASLSNISILGNEVNGAFYDGLVIASNVQWSSTTISNNKLIDARRNSVILYGSTATSAMTGLSNNAFTGSIASIVNADAGSSISATCNWYGTTSANAIASKISGNVTYISYLTNGTDNSASIGFQPVSGSCVGTPLSLNESHVNIVCSGGTTGSINLTVSGGTSPFSYAWTKSGDVSYSASTEDLSNLASGTYTVVVTDANNSTATTSIEITSGNVSVQVAVSVDGTNALPATAGGGTTTICANSAYAMTLLAINQGSGPMTFVYNVRQNNISGTILQSNVSTGPISAGGTIYSAAAGTLSAGTYFIETLSITDAQGCQVQPVIMSAGYYNHTLVVRPAVQVAISVDGINPLPATAGGGTTTICSNSAYAMTLLAINQGSGPMTFVYNVRQNNISGTILQNNVSSGPISVGGTIYSAAAGTLSAGTYFIETLSITDAQGCKVQPVIMSAGYYNHTLVVRPAVQVAVSVDGTNPLPATPGGGTSTICANSAFAMTLLAIIQGTGPMTFVYNIRQNNITGTIIQSNVSSGPISVGGTIYSTSADTWAAGTYFIETLSITDAQGCKVQPLAMSGGYYNHTLVVRPAVEITTQPSKVARKVALNIPAVPYTITAAASSSLTYQWYSNTTASNSGGVLIAGATSNSYTPPTSTAYTAYFYCVVSNENSCSRASDVSEVFIVCN